MALDKSQIPNYNGRCGYVLVTAIAYDLLAWQERQNPNDKTIGDLFYMMNDYLPDIKFENALIYLLQRLKSIKDTTKEVINQLCTNFMERLSKLMQETLENVVSVSNLEQEKTYPIAV